MCNCIHWKGREEKQQLSVICFQIFDWIWFKQSAAQLLQEEVLLLNNTSPLYMVLHLLFSVETTFILFTPTMFLSPSS